MNIWKSSIWSICIGTLSETALGSLSSPLFGLTPRQLMGCQLPLWISSPVLLLGGCSCWCSNFRIILQVDLCLRFWMHNLICSKLLPSYISNRCYNIFHLVPVLEPLFVIWKLFLKCPDCLFLIKDNILGLFTRLLADLIGLMQWSILFFEFYILVMKVVRFYELFLELIIFFLKANIQFFEFSIDLLELLLVVWLGTDAALAAAVWCQALLGLREPYLSDALLCTVAWSR